MCKEKIMQESVRKGQFYILHKKSSEEIASFIHFLMVIQPKEKPNLPPKPKEETEETSPTKVGKQQKKPPPKEEKSEDKKDEGKGRG